MVSDNKLQEGFYQGPDSITACGGTEKINPVSKQSEKVGFCLPAGQTETNITFGNKKNFLHLGDFIQFIYGYGIIIASILAVVMIILGGVQYMASGSMLSGKKDQVNGAKKRIAGGVIGLTIALLSYTILSTINPQLVAFRLPQIWMINTIAEPVEYCTDLKNDELVAPLGTAVERTEDLPKENRKSALASLYERANFTQAPKEAKCGNEFFIQKGNGFTCRGVACPRKGEACHYPSPLSNNAKEPSCVTANFTASLSAPARIMCGDLESTIIDGEMGIIALCKSGEIHYLGGDDLEEGDFEIRIGGISDAKIDSICGSYSGLSGFYIGAQINDEGGGFLGKQCPGNSFSAGEDDWHAIGLTAPGSNTCSVNLGSLGFELLFSKKPDCESRGSYDRTWNCNCGTISGNDRVKKLATNPDFIKHLITREELKQGKFCKIHISRNDFPDIDNNALKDQTSCYANNSESAPLSMRGT